MHGRRPLCLACVSPDPSFAIESKQSPSASEKIAFAVYPSERKIVNQNVKENA